MRTILSVLAALGTACTGEAGRPNEQPIKAVVTLEQHDATHPAAFSRITDVHELPDGRVLVSDRREKNVVLLDFTTGTSTQVGRQGSGPGEYLFPGEFYPQPDGSVLLNDFFTRRFLVIDGAGRAHDVIPFPGAAGLGIETGGADDQGRVYFRTRPFGDMDEPGAPGNIRVFPDSLAIMRWDPKSGAVDTAGWVAVPRTRISARAGDNGGVSADPPVFTPGEIWGVAPDGAVARVLPEPYQVMWYHKDSVIVGEIQPYTPIPVTEADRQAHYENEKGMRPVVVSIGDGAVTRIGEGQPVRSPGRREFEAIKPPFLFDADIHVTPDGDVWVLRSRASGDSIPRYDVFDRRGRKVREVRLRPSSRIVGFGRGTTYVVRTGDDDLQYLERFRR